MWPADMHTIGMTVSLDRLCDWTVSKTKHEPVSKTKHEAVFLSLNSHIPLKKTSTNSSYFSSHATLGSQLAG